jgi:hypothetical protein
MNGRIPIPPIRRHEVPVDLGDVRELVDDDDLEPAGLAATVDVDAEVAPLHVLGRVDDAALRERQRGDLEGRRHDDRRRPQVAVAAVRHLVGAHERLREAEVERQRVARTVDEREPAREVRVVPLARVERVDGMVVREERLPVVGESRLAGFDELHDLVLRRERHRGADLGCPVRRLAELVVRPLVAVELQPRAVVLVLCLEEARDELVVGHLPSSRRWMSAVESRNSHVSFRPVLGLSLAILSHHAFASASA